MKEVEPEMTFIFHYRLDHGLQLKSYLKLIMKSIIGYYKWKHGRYKFKKVLFGNCCPNILENERVIIVFRTFECMYREAPSRIIAPLHSTN